MKNWIIENDAFSNGDILLSALKKLNMPYKIWNDEFWNTKEYKQIEREYRYVCINDKIITGCEYLAEGRKGVVSEINNNSWNFAQKIADLKKQSDFIYIIDVCESEGKLFLVEMNPFSGADLYCCDAEKIIEEIK